MLVKFQSNLNNKISDSCQTVVRQSLHNCAALQAERLFNYFYRKILMQYVTIFFLFQVQKYLKDPTTHWLPSVNPSKCHANFLSPIMACHTINVPTKNYQQLINHSLNMMQIQRQNRKRMKNQSFGVPHTLTTTVICSGGASAT